MQLTVLDIDISDIPENERHCSIESQPSKHKGILLYRYEKERVIIWL